MKYYILENMNPKQVDDINEFAKFFNSAERVILVTNYEDKIKVSTVFLGIDHSFFGGPPLLFETMIFGIDNDRYQTRCSTYYEALEMHKEAEDFVASKIK